MRRTVTTTVAVLLGLGLAGCGSSSPSASTTASAGASAGSTVSGDITVLAAASLTESFTTLGKQFEAAHPGVKVTLSFGASSALATQITSGAPADVFASASAKNMDAVVSAGDATSPMTFANNVMEIAVPPSNPGRVTGVESLAGSGVKTALCQEQVPCGATAAKVFTNAGVTVTPVTLEPDVKSVLSKVTLGEVDAGLVYVTDVRAAGDKVTGIEIPADVNASTSYPIATLSKAPNAATAQAFVDYVLSAEGSTVLTAAGFQKP
ncbi:molybdate ABC transporter substrate-binding protein [Arthrobacter sp. NEB 688]|uniref:molybdate ABC transporter substrate-binding protein n=1 Tax=Arthrobacter sp. NEB 688 TaxID=904039 RepID=UPI00256FE05C|nr:molybdate ABC transporter substrate-binding protein [Arthrobacter sp. NEB 688]